MSARLLFLSLLFISFFIQKFSFANSTLDLTKIVDVNLSACIAKQAEKQRWQKLSDVKAIKCHGKKINNLAGLENFSNLEKLSLFNNKLTQRTFTPLKILNILILPITS